MPDPQHRRLTLGDAMFLVAATAPGLLLLRYAWELGLFGGPNRGVSPYPGRDLLEYLSVSGGCMLIGLAVAVLVLSFRGGRARFREVIDGPGVVACIAVMVAAVFPAADFATSLATLPTISNANLAVPFNNLWASLNHVAGPMIVGAWLALALSGRWRLKPAWTDRLGCVVAACWIFIYALQNFYFIAIALLLR